MREEVFGRPISLACLAPAFLAMSLLLPAGASEQKAAPAGEAPDSTVDAAALEALVGRLAARRSELNARRQALAGERARLSAVDEPAGEADLALWRDRAAAGDRLERDMQALRTLRGVLTPEALQAVSLPEASTGQRLVPDPGLSRTTIGVNLRVVPGHPPFAVVKADTLVVRLATDVGGGWSLVATPSGIGFVPVSQLSREQ